MLAIQVCRLGPGRRHRFNEGGFIPIWISECLCGAGTETDSATVTGFLADGDGPFLIFQSPCRTMGDAVVTVHSLMPFIDALHRFEGYS